MPSLAPKMELSSGYTMPILGLGTWTAGKMGEVKQAVITAIEAGYRHIDGAHVYENEKEVGEGLKAKIEDGTVKREDLFVVSKLWDTAHRPDQVLPAIKRTLGDLGLEYLDLYLMHWPMAMKPAGDDLFPKDPEGNTLVDNETDFVDTWKKMEELVRLGLTKSIGISNFNSAQIERILANATIAPAVIQIEVHPYLQQHQLLEFCKKRGIKVTAYSPFGSPQHDEAGHKKLLEEPTLLELAKKYGKGPNHIILKWLIQRDLITIPKSTTKSRIIDNFQVFDFTLTEEDVKQIESLDKGLHGRVFKEEFMKASKDYPFNIAY